MGLVFYFLVFGFNNNGVIKVSNVLVYTLSSSVLLLSNGIYDLNSSKGGSKVSNVIYFIE